MMKLVVVLFIFLSFQTNASIDKFRLEAELVSTMEVFSGQLETALHAINTYAEEVHKVYLSECGGDENCSDDVISERIVGNPIYNYQLLKRSIVFLKKVEDSIYDIDVKGTAAQIKKLKKKYGGLPNEDDQNISGKTLLRLIETYDLDIEGLANGIIGGARTGAKLSEGDLFQLGKLASLSRNSEMSVKILGALTSKNYSETTNSQERLKAESFLKIEQRKVKLQDYKDKSGAEYVLGHIPPKTNVREAMFSEHDHINYNALCQGTTLAKQLKLSAPPCFYSTQNHAYYILQPLAIEEVYPEPHRILIYHGVLTDTETEELAAAATPFMKTSLIGSAKEISETRVSRTAFIEDGVVDIVDRVNRKINLMTGLSGTKVLDPEGRKEQFEYLQLAKYGIGGHFYLHHDPMFVYRDSEFVAKSIENPSNPYNTGDRMSTLMFYLNNVAEGGYTAFPRLGVAVRPERGSAVLWHNLDPEGFSDMHMLHAGCPVLLGSKMVANKWFREVANGFRRPCRKSR